MIDQFEILVVALLVSIYAQVYPTKDKVDRFFKGTWELVAAVVWFVAIVNAFGGFD